ncbi:MAG: hypothetical protein WDN67_03240 [Candidatus Moraniibacteriota bacterium]
MRRAKSKILWGLAAVLGAAVLFLGIFWAYRFFSQAPTLADQVAPLQQAGVQALSDLESTASLPITQEEGKYRIKDTQNSGIQITRAGEEPEDKTGFELTFPESQKDPLEVKLDEQRTLTVQDQNAEEGKASLLSRETLVREAASSFFSRLFPKQDASSLQYLRYQSGRKTVLYSYQKDQASGERTLKNWILYERGYRTGKGKLPIHQCQAPPQ